MKKTLIFLLFLFTMPIIAQKVKFPEYPIYDDVLRRLTNDYIMLIEEQTESLKNKDNVNTILQNTLHYYYKKFNKTNSSHMKMYFSKGKVNKYVSFAGITEDSLYSAKTFMNDTLVGSIEFENNQDLGHGFQHQIEKGKLLKIITNYSEKNRKNNNYTKYNNGIQVTDFVFQDNRLLKIQNLEQAAGKPRVNVDYLYKDKNILEIKYNKGINSIEIYSIQKINNEEKNIFNYSYARAENLLVENLDYNFLLNYVEKNATEKSTKEYDAEGNLIYRRETDDYIERKFYKNDKIATIKVYNKDIPKRSIVFKYNTRNQIEDEAEIDNNGVADKRVQSTYNNFGDLISQKTQMFTDGKPFHTSIYTYEYKYDKYNNWIERKTSLNRELSDLKIRTIEYNN
ncbi:hypothetical protein [Flavobacterium collinsii]|uniref:YD repeat-containing protein n=1 Tax=Flavobacterium collinsii TaxID=1114861 RepID=A0ABN7EPG6_9FLAO|nr:hypothetical protein [Flavobacterium collinsii]CAA9200913.1 hypothetical protein FLACOL7796_03522 [Flavobacterium collinsii]